MLLKENAPGREHFLKKYRQDWENESALGKRTSLNKDTQTLERKFYRGLSQKESVF